MSHATETKSPKFPILNRVVDSLDIRIYRDNTPSTWLIDALEEIRTALKNYRPGQVAIIKIPGLGSWQIRHSKQPIYEFKLENPRIGDIRVWNPEKWRSGQVVGTGQFYISFRSVFLQAGGIPAVMRFIDALCGVCFSPAVLGNRDAVDFDRISRADLAVDYADLNIHDLPEKHKNAYSVIPWTELDNYQARGKRLRREGWLSPFKEDTRDVLTTVLQRAKATKSQLQKVLGHDFLRQFPDKDNRGGHCNATERNGFLGSKIAAPVESDFDGLSASLDTPTTLAVERGLDLFASMLLQGIESDGSAYTTRVIGSRRGAQTLYFGRMGGELYCREYNKLASIFAQEKTYMIDIWLRSGWDGEAPVYRCEFSLAGEFLQQFIDLKSGERMDLRNPRVFQEWIPRVWAYLTRTWLRHTVPRGKNRANWQPSERWQTIQNAWTTSDKLERVKKSPTPTSEHLKAGMNGYAKSITALEATKPEHFARALSDLNLDSIPTDRKGLKAFREKLLEIAKNAVIESLSSVMIDEKGAFDFEVLERQTLFGVDLESDAAFSAMLRRERIEEGGGS